MRNEPFSRAFSSPRGRVVCGGARRRVGVDWEVIIMFAPEEDDDAPRAALERPAVLPPGGGGRRAVDRLGFSRAARDSCVDSIGEIY